jgi:hypothetical protein
MRSLLRRVRRFEPRGSWLLAGAALVVLVEAALVVLVETDAHALPGGARLVYSRSRGAERCLDEEDFRDLVASHLGGVDPFSPEAPAPAESPAKPEPARKAPPPAPAAPASRGTLPAGQAPGAARPRAPPGGPAARSRVQIGVGPLLGFGFLPARSVGMTALAGVRWPATSLLIELRGDLPVTARPAEGVSLETSWFGGSLGACQHASAVLVCGLATAGRVERVTRYNGGAWASTEPYLGLGLRAGLEVPLSSHLAGQLAGDGVLTLHEPRLELDARRAKPGPQELWSAPPFAAAVSLRLVASF